MTLFTFSLQQISGWERDRCFWEQAIHLFAQSMRLEYKLVISISPVWYSN